MVSNALIIAGASLVLIGVLGLILRRRSKPEPADAETEETR
jgi:LPXTG-motif cell wall-anchored protein